MANKFSKPNGRYMNIKVEMMRNKVTQKDIADFLGVNAANVSYKINGYRPLRVSELVAIRNKFFPDATLDYLAQTS